MFKRLSLFFIFLLLLSTLVESFHYHDDGEDHPECSICVATHQQSDEGYTAPACLLPCSVAETVHVRPVTAVVGKCCFSPANNRAPPA